MITTHTNTKTKDRTKTKTRTKTNKKIKCLKGSMYVIFLKGVRFKDFKFYIGYQLAITMTHTKIKTMTKAKCFKDPAVQ